MTVTGVENVAVSYTAVKLKLENTGIAIYEGRAQERGADVPRRQARARRRGRARRRVLAHGSTATRCGSTSAAPAAAACSSRRRRARRPSASSSRSRSCRPRPAGSGTCASVSRDPDRLDHDRGLGEVGARVGDDRADLVDDRLAAGDLAQQRVLGRELARRRRRSRRRTASPRSPAGRRRPWPSRRRPAVDEVLRRASRRPSSPGRRCRRPAGRRPGARSPGRSGGSAVPS